MSYSDLLASHIPTLRGRPSSYSPESFAVVCSIIAERGYSDSAAASLAGVSTSSLGRWKKESGDVRIALLQARQEFRATQLEVVLEASRTPRGWRAAAWLLERVFPEEYSPRAAEREKFQELAARREAEYEQPDAATADPADTLDAGPAAASASVADSQNSQNSAVTAPAPATADSPHPEGSAKSPAGDQPTQKQAGTAQPGVSASEARSQNSQNSGATGVAPHNHERRPRPNEVPQGRQPVRRAA